MKGLSEKQKGIISLIVLAIIWSAMGIFARYLHTDFTIFQQVYLRLFAAFLIGYVFFRKDIHIRKSKQLSVKDWLFIVVRALFYYSIGISLYSASVIQTKLSNANFIESMPVTAILGFILLKEKVTWQKIVFVLLSFIGVYLVGFKGFQNLFSWGIGETLMFMSVWSTSFAIVIRKMQNNKLNNKEMTLLILFIGAVGSLIFSLLNGESLPLSQWTFGLIIIVALAGVANTFITYLINYGFERVEAVLGSNLLTLQPLFAIVLGFIFYKEVPVFKELVGGGMIMLSVIQMNRLENNKK